MTLADLPGVATQHVTSATLHTLRLLPVAILCPFLGGPLVPPVVRLAIAVGMGVSAHLAFYSPAPCSEIDFAIAAARELALGGVIGVVAAVPLEAARAGGRLADTLRGATLSEFHVPLIRQRETALGDLLAQWSVVLATWAGGDRLVVRAIFGTFEAIPIGHPLVVAPLLTTALRSTSELVSCALALAAPSVAGVLAADFALALAARTAPTLNVASAAQPARAALGLFAVVAAAAAMAGRLVSTVVLSAGFIQNLTGGAP